MLQSDRVNHKTLLGLVFIWAIIQGAATPLTGMNQRGIHSLSPAFFTGLYFLAAALFFPFPQMLMKRFRVYTLAKLAVFLGVLSILPMGMDLPPEKLAICRILQGISSTLLLVTVETELLTTSTAANRAGALGQLEVWLVLGGGTGAALAPLIWSITPWMAGLIPAIPAMIVLIMPFKSSASNYESPICPAQSGSVRSATPLFLIMTAMAQGLVEGVLMAFLTPWLISNHWNETSISAAFASLFAGIISSQIYLSRLAFEHGYGNLLIICHMGVAIGFFYLACPNHEILTLSALFIIGLGIGCQYPVAQAGLAESVSPQHIPLAASIFLASNAFGCLISSPLGGFIQSTWGTVFLYNCVGTFCLTLVLAGLGDCWIARKSTS